MSVDLQDLVPSLKREANPPGTDLYPAVTDDQWLGYLTDAFWEARLNGMLAGFTEDGGLVTPLSGTVDMTRDLQQLVVLFAGYRIVLTSFQNINSLYRAKAGPVEYEVQKSAQTLKGLLDAFKARLDFLLTNLSTLAGQTNASMFDAVIESTYSIALHDSWFVR